VASVSFTAAFILYVVAWLVGWFFILGRAIVLGIVCNAVIFERFGGITNFVFSWPLIRMLRRFSLMRRVFDLEESQGSKVGQP
jgi:hypothetical protein